MRTLITLFFFTICPFLSAQNLIPNPSFENMSDYDCANPIDGFVNTTDWYSWGTPHLYRYGCRYDQVIWNQFLPSLRATEGINTLGFIGNLLVNGYYGSTTMAAELVSPVVPGQQYYYQMYAANRGFWHLYPDSLKVCDTDPARSIFTYFGDEFIMDSVILARREPSHEFTSPELADTAVTQWLLFSDCFEVDQMSTHIAMGQNRGEAVMDAPCEVRNIAQGLTYFTYHTRIDELVLYPIPNRVDTTLISCRPLPFTVNIRKLAKLPKSAIAEIVWEDGFEGEERELADEGVYTAEVRLSCSTFPVAVTVELADCGPKIYSATAFSPNDDGQNDSFRPVIQEGFPIANYRLSMYDRWGRLVFQTLDETSEWNGTLSGQLAQEGVYAWVLTFDVVSDRDRVQVVRDGSVTLLR